MAGNKNFLLNEFFESGYEFIRNRDSAYSGTDVKGQEA